MASDRGRPRPRHTKKPSWINSSFGTCDNIENGTSDSDNEIEQMNENTKPRPRTRPSARDLPHIGRPRPRPTTSETLGLPSSISSLALDLPRNRDDLAVHKKKVDEIDAWLVQACCRPRPSNSVSPMILLLTGPTGAGKTAALKVLASSKQIHIIEWTNPMDDIFESDRRNPGPNQASKFEDFLLSSARYNSVIGPSPSKKLILVEDYPNSLLLNPEQFHNIIRKYLYMGKSPLVFIATDVSCGQNIAYNIFPPPIINELNIQNISFNSVAKTSLMKALALIIKHESLSNVSLDMQSAICDSCNGDIRNAVLALRYLTQVGPGYKLKNPVAAPLPQSRKRKAGIGKGKSCNKEDSNIDLKGKDCPTGILHSAARVLYAKREKVAVRGGADADKRGALQSDPQEIVNQFVSQSHHFVALLHENYCSIFSDIHSVAKATKNMCDADILMSDWTERDLLKEVGLTIAVRGVMNACNNPVQRWNPLQKPKWKEIVLKSNQYLRNMQCSTSKMSFTNRALCMDFELLHGTNLNSMPTGNLFVPTGIVDTTPVSPLPHITDDESDEQQLP